MKNGPLNEVLYGEIQTVNGWYFTIYDWSDVAIQFLICSETASFRMFRVYLGERKKMRYNSSLL